MRVTILPFGDTVDVEPNEPVLAAILRNGRFVKYGCKHGGCGTCRAEALEGGYRLGDNTSFALSDSDRARGIVLLCSTFPDVAFPDSRSPDSAFPDADGLVVDVSETMADLSEEQYLAGQRVQQYMATVDRLDALTHDIRWLGLRLDEPAEMAFTAGQYVEVGVPGAAGQWRSYSMANPPAESGRVDLIVKLVPGGRFSAALRERLARGDRLRLRGPLGNFGTRLSHRQMIMVAGGSGKAPILAMLKDLAATGNRRKVTFCYGARTDRDLFLLAEIGELARDNPWLTFVPALSEPQGNSGPWQGETGLVTEVLARRLPSTKGMEAYLCGPAGMVDAAIGVLKASGCKERHIYFDRFVPTGPIVTVSTKRTTGQPVVA